MATAVDYQGEREAALREVKEADEEIAGLRRELEGLAFKARSDKGAAKRYAEVQTAIRNAQERKHFAEAAVRGAEAAEREAAERAKAEKQEHHRRELDRIARERLAVAKRADARLAEVAEDFAELERLRHELDSHTRALGYGAQPANRARHGVYEGLRSVFLSRGLLTRQLEPLPAKEQKTLEERERENMGRFLINEEGSA